MLQTHNPHRWFEDKSACLIQLAANVSNREELDFYFLKGKFENFYLSLLSVEAVEPNKLTEPV